MATTVSPLGLHSVTGVASDPQRNVDFSLEVLGVRLIKQTVSFDAPDTYHLSYGDELGNAGTILTFFPWPHAPVRPARRRAATVSLHVPEGSLGWWKDRVERRGVEVLEAGTRLEEDHLLVADPDGLHVELVAAHSADPRPPWEKGPIPHDHAIRGLYAVTVTEEEHGPTAEHLTDHLGLRLSGAAGERVRFDVSDGGPGARIDVLARSGGPQRMVASGTLHHVAWRAPHDEAQLAWRQEIVDRGLSVTAVLDRNYFHSISFREPGGMLFEIATDGPGFTIDESAEALGADLQLPPWLEPRRDEILAHLPPLKVPDIGVGEGAA